MSLVMLLLVPVGHMTKKHGAPDFNCLDLRNAMMQLLTLMALGDASANGVT